MAEVCEKRPDDAVQAAAGVFNEYGGFIRAVIRFQARRKQDEEDLFQGFFLALIRKPVPADVRSIKSFLYRAIVNHVLDSARAGASYHHRRRKYAEDARISVNKSSSGTAFVRGQEEKNAAAAHFARYLQKREAQAFVLRYQDQCSNTEIAVRMGIDKRTVSRYLSAALKKLRRILANRVRDIDESFWW